jgi:hypothetical protein
VRTLMTVRIDAAAGSRALKAGRLQVVLQNLAEQIKPETAFFTSVDGDRTAFFVFDMKDTSDIPRLAEPAFQELDAKVSFAPVMNQDDLMAGLAKL